MRVSKFRWISREGRWEPEQWRGEVTLKGRRKACVCGGGSGNRMRGGERGRIYKYIQLLINLKA